MKRWPTLLIPCVGVLVLVIAISNSNKKGAEDNPTSDDKTPIAHAIDNNPDPSAGFSPPTSTGNGNHLLSISISPESRVKASAGGAIPLLKKESWIEFPIEIENSARMTAPLIIESDQAMQSDDDSARDRWLKIELKPSGQLTGDLNEKRTIRLWSRDHGKRAAILHVNAGQGTQDLGFRSDVLITFDIAPSNKMANVGREEAQKLLERDQ